LLGRSVLNLYCSIIGVELTTHRPPSAPVVTWNSWHHYLLHKIKLELEAAFMHPMCLGAALGLHPGLKRSDFTKVPDAAAQVKEAQFKTRI
jgi:hypothetical protein